MKKTFLTLGLLMAICGLLSGFQYKERKEYIDSLPVLLEPLAVVEVTAEDASAAPTEEVPVFDGVCK